MSSKIQVKNPIVDLDGDEMTRIIWSLIKEQLIFPYLDLDLKYFDLHLSNRDQTEDRVTYDSAYAIQEYGVGVKCATITPNKARVEEYALKAEWPSPNGTIRSILDGTVFRKPIILSNIPPSVRSWVKPITIGRHAYGDIYRAREMTVAGPGKVELVYTPTKGAEERILVHDFDAPGVVMGMHNLQNSIESFVKSCVTYALSEKMELWFAAKDTISKKYHVLFRDAMQAEVDRRKEDFKKAGINYRYLLIDDAAAQLMKHEGGMLLALMNYDGDVWSDFVAGGFGSLGLMTSALVSPTGQFQFEAAHGTVTRHYRKHLAGEKTSTNSVASIFAWTGAIAKRGELDGTPAVVRFAETLEQSVITTIESGTMTKDLTALAGIAESKAVLTDEFIFAVRKQLDKTL